MDPTNIRLFYSLSTCWIGLFAVRPKKFNYLADRTGRSGITTRKGFGTSVTTRNSSNVGGNYWFVGATSRKSDAARARDGAAQSPVTSPAPGLSNRWIQRCTGLTQHTTRQRLLWCLSCRMRHCMPMPAGLDSGAIGFAATDSVGPGDGDAN